MIWSCFRSLRRNISYLEEEHNPNTVKDLSASNIVMCITAVETFINMYFRVLAEEDKYQNHRDIILEELKPQNGSQTQRGLYF